jgi:hypothetical protein
LISRLQKDGFVNLAAGITSGKRRRDRKILKPMEDNHLKKVSSPYYPK